MPAFRTDIREPCAGAELFGSSAVVYSRRYHG